MLLSERPCRWKQQGSNGLGERDQAVPTEKKTLQASNNKKV